MRDLRESHGTAVAVSDTDILEAQRQLGRSKGIFSAPEGAATLVAYKKPLAQKWLDPREKVVLFNIGSGLKIWSRRFETYFARLVGKSDDSSKGKPFEQ